MKTGAKREILKGGRRERGERQIYIVFAQLARTVVHHNNISLVPRPLPDFISQLAVEKN